MNVLELVRHGSPDVAFSCRDHPDPAPGPGQVRIAVEASGVNFADIMARRGTYPEAPRPPCVLGFEVVGRIESLGPGVGSEILAPGRRVVALTRFGGYASRAIAAASATMPIPENMDPGSAAALATQGVTAYLAAEGLVHIEPGDHVLVHAAAGGVGTLLVQLARARGAVVIGTAGSEAKLEHMRRLGVTHAINYRERDFVPELLRLTGGRRPDVIFDAIGGASVRKGLALLASGGRMVSYGVATLSGSGWALPRAVRMFIGFGLIHPLTLLVHSKGILGLNLLALGDDRPELVGRALAATVDRAARGTLVPVVDRAFPATAVAEAHAYVEARKSMGKVVLLWDQAPAGSPGAAG
ncbi:MAG: zinc-binding dehydrogenase [Candidatus Eisenbacteria bacterium]